MSKPKRCYSCACTDAKQLRVALVNVITKDKTYVCKKCDPGEGAEDIIFESLYS